MNGALEHISINIVGVNGLDYRMRICNSQNLFSQKL